jgi:hypothetical protein
MARNNLPLLTFSGATSLLRSKYYILRCNYSRKPLKRRPGTIVILPHLRQVLKISYLIGKKSQRLRKRTTKLKTESKLLDHVKWMARRLTSVCLVTELKSIAMINPAHHTGTVRKSTSLVGLILSLIC